MLRAYCFAADAVPFGQVVDLFVVVAVNWLLFKSCLRELCPQYILNSAARVVLTELAKAKRSSKIRHLNIPKHLV